MVNLYELLNVDPDASKKEIKKAYRDLAKVHHPDKGGDEAEFKDIEQAHAILTDDIKRAKYDAGEDVFSPEVTVYQEAMMRLYPLMTQTVEGYSFEADHSPLFEEMIAKIRGINTQIHKDIEIAHTEVRNWEGVVARIKKGDAFRAAAENQTASYNNTIKKLKHEIVITEKMEEILEGCEYDHEEDTEAKAELGYAGHSGYKEGTCTFF